MSQQLTGGLLLLALAPEGAAPLAPVNKLLTWAGLGRFIAVLAGIVLVAGLVRVLWGRYNSVRRGGDGAAGLDPLTLRQIWERFLARLPKGPRALVTRYPSMVVLGPTGSGKSQVIRSFVDWQGQSSQFLPSLIDSPLVQIYLGNRLIVEEVGAQVLYNNAPVAKEALQRLWQPLCRERAPTALIVLKLPMLEAASSEERAELGHQLRGKLSLLGKLVGGAIETRIVLTHLDEVPGFVSFARFCAQHRIPLSIPLKGAAQARDIATAADELTRYLPLALTKLDAAEYRQVVVFLRELPRAALALEGLLQPLVEWSVSSAALSLDRLYLYAAREGAHGTSPFAGRRMQPVIGLGARLRALLPASLRGAQWHLLGVGALLLVAATILIGSAVRHGRAIRRANEAVQRYEDTVKRAEGALGDVRESPAVRTASRETREALDVLQVTEGAWALHEVFYRGAKALVKSRFLKTTREAYFFPLIKRFGAQRDTERMLHTLAVIYASRDSALGALVNSELSDIANSLEISDAILTDYTNLSDQAYETAVTVPWARLLSGPAPTAAQPETWKRFFRELQQVYRAQAVTPEQLRQLQQGAAPLLRVADAVRGKRKLAQMLKAISEESPLVEIETRIGAHHPELRPPDWLRDQQAAISGVLRLVHDTDQTSVRAGQMGLAQILRLLTDLDERKQRDDHAFQFEIEDQSFSFSQRAWQDILLRGRNQLVLGALYKATGPVEGAAGRTSLRADAATEPREPALPRDGDGDGGSVRGAKAKKDRRHGHKLRRGARGSEEPSSKKSRKSRRADAELERGGSDPASLRRTADPRAPESMSASEAAMYSRASFEQGMKTLLQKLDKELGDDSGLPAAQRQALTRYVQDEARRYAERYCAALLVQHRGYVFPGGALSSTRSALLELGAPTGSLISHLKKIAENASLPSLDGRFTQSLASCLGQFAPVAAAVTPAKDGTYPGLKPYIEIIAGMLKELDTGKPAEAREDGKPQTLQDLLTPLGRLGFSILAQQEGSPDRKVRQFLDSAGLGGLLAPPFLAPVQHVARLGLSDVEQVLATLRNAGVTPEDLEIGRADLEDVFLEIMQGARA